ncbi:hypothetical protein [Anaerosporobacter sp.]|uniref:hypothetical protein n=1 Tax=Anaerosporobacter sp. TaxID=1872529 RepID=UPI00286F9116|nr:hypothetical protein [Anaerosporobacter sp.]
MAGYYGFSMSNNAVQAYEDGEKSISKWTKSDILKAIKTAEIELQCSLSLLKKLHVEDLREVALFQSSWHHTGTYYNETAFYYLDYGRLETITDNKLMEIIEYSKQNAARKKESIGIKWRCAFLEWSGTRNHPKATEVVEEGIVKGNFFYRKDGSKKRTDANGFRFIEKLQ